MYNDPFVLTTHLSYNKSKITCKCGHDASSVGSSSSGSKSGLSEGGSVRKQLFATWNKIEWKLISLRGYFPQPNDTEIAQLLNHQNQTFFY